ncbi:endo-1,4-beta-xylanase [Pedobacter sp. P26]|uniref:endo-1,4-beta-xylanase n=1 Tax=Pedobacter sp. P26 TaxID=3423956 RepID=UPI003D66B403
MFREFKKDISSVTFWNLSDRSTWLDQYPVPGRKNYPLLFDKNLQRKKLTVVSLILVNNRFYLKNEENTPFKQLGCAELD